MNEKTVGELFEDEIVREQSHLELRQARKEMMVKIILRDIYFGLWI